MGEDGYIFDRTMQQRLYLGRQNGPDRLAEMMLMSMKPIKSMRLEPETQTDTAQADGIKDIDGIKDVSKQ